MMKHPKYRVSDILLLDKAVREELFDYILMGFKQFVPFPCRPQLVGSYSFGCANYQRDDEGNKIVTLSSDLDINGACADWNTQIPARMWSRAQGNLRGLVDHFQKWEFKTGLKIDVGFIDAQSHLYNIHADLEDQILHFRYGGEGDSYLVNDVRWPPSVKVDDHPVDIRKFNPETDELPPAVEQMLRFDNFAFRWLSIDHPKRIGGWSVDKWADEVPKWRERYGKHFLEYDFAAAKALDDQRKAGIGPKRP